jgi:hypothetical protein
MLRQLCRGTPKNQIKLQVKGFGNFRKKISQRVLLDYVLGEVDYYVDICFSALNKFILSPCFNSNKALDKKRTTTLEFHKSHSRQGGTFKEICSVYKRTGRIINQVNSLSV